MTNNFETPQDVASDKKEAVDVPGAELLEKSLEEEAEKALERIGEVASRAEALAEHDPVLRDHAMTLRNRAVKLGRQIKGAAKVIGLAVSIMLAAEAIDYDLTRYNVSEHADDHGKLVFEHQDEETTRILDYLSGRGDLPKADRLALEIERINKFPDVQKRISISKKLEEMNEAELSEVWDEIQEMLHEQYPGYTYKKGD
jgi:hypothetical protein